MSASGGSSEILTHLSGMARSVLDALTTGAIVFDRDLRILYRNESAKRLLADGSSAAAALDASFRQSPIEHWDVELRCLLRCGRSRCYGEIACDAEPVTGARVSLTVTPIPVIDGAPSPGGMIIAEPATRVENADRTFNAGQRDDIAARVAHELNNPLDGVLRYVSLAIGKLQGEESPAATECLEQARDGLHRMARIVREVLGYARSNGPTAAPVAINHAVEEAIRSFEDRAAKSGIVITASLRNENMPAVRGNKLVQVCSNIVANALDAMPDGGMLTVSTGVAESVVVLRFEDTGIGLPDEAERIWDPFFTTKADAEGTGLGLAICKDFVERLGGSITAEPRDGGGTAFTVRLPVDRCLSMDATTTSTPKGL